MHIQQLTVGSMGVCCYIVSCKRTGHGVVIDPGGDEERILAIIRQDNLQIEYIINTHGHPDHVCGNRTIKEATGAAIVLHQLDADFFARDEVKDYFAVLGMEESPPPEVLVQDSDLVSFGECELQVLHTPGHTPGSICLYGQPHCFTGDTLFVGGVGRTDFPGGSMEDLIHSIRTKLLTLPGSTTVWPGHGYGGSRSTIADEAKSNPYL